MRAPACCSGSLRGVSHGWRDDSGHRLRRRQVGAGRGAVSGLCQSRAARPPLQAAEYEQQRRNELLMEKARLLVSEATTLTPTELQEVKDLHARQTLEGAEPDMTMFEQIKMQFVLQKKQRAMQAFQAGLRARGNITIHEELL